MTFHADTVAQARTALAEAKHTLSNLSAFAKQRRTELAECEDGIAIAVAQIADHTRLIAFMEAHNAAEKSALDAESEAGR